VIKLALLLAAVAVAAPLAAQSNVLGAAIAAGQAGERYDGYMGTPGAASEILRRQVAAINLRRRNLYIELATRRGVLPDVVGLTTACELFAQLAPGEAYMLKDGGWRRLAAGQPAARPEHCR
jgi:uncharacterized protein YdbL (DUF1318 family)